MYKLVKTSIPISKYNYGFDKFCQPGACKGFKTHGALTFIASEARKNFLSVPDNSLAPNLFSHLTGSLRKLLLRAQK